MSKLLAVITKYENEVESEISELRQQNEALKQELAQQAKLLQESTNLASKHTLALGCCLQHLRELGLTNKELNEVTLSTLNLYVDQ